MNLAQIRDAVITLSGRYDLSDPVGLSGDSTLPAPAIDNYIRDGSQLLDDLAPGNLNAAEERTWQDDVAAGQVLVDLQMYVRSIKEVWITNSERRTPVEKRSLRWLYTQYRTPLTSLTGGRPIYYAIAKEKRAALAQEGTYDQDILLAGQRSSKRALMIMPPPDGVYTLTVIGLFGSEALVADTDTNFWSETRPRDLIHASLYYLEVAYRNRTGASEWLETIMLSMNALEKNAVEEEIADIDTTEELYV